MGILLVAGETRWREAKTKKKGGEGKGRESNPANLQTGCPCREPCIWFCMVLLFPTQVIHLSVLKSKLGLETCYEITIIN